VATRGAEHLYRPAPAVGMFIAVADCRIRVYTCSKLRFFVERGGDGMRGGGVETGARSNLN